MSDTRLDYPTLNSNASIITHSAKKYCVQKYFTYKWSDENDILAVKTIAADNLFFGV